MTVLGAAGHMHLLGRKITIEANPDTPDAKTLLDIPVWDFDDQGAKPVDPVHLDAGDTVRVTCQHQQWLRDRLPAFETQREDRYVIWAEGSTDEMCLGHPAGRLRRRELSARASRRAAQTGGRTTWTRPASRANTTGSPKTTSSAQAVNRCSGLAPSSLPAKSSSAPSGTWWVSPIRRASSGRWPPGNHDGGVSSSPYSSVVVDLVVDRRHAATLRRARRNSLGARRGTRSMEGLRAPHERLAHPGTHD